MFQYNIVAGKMCRKEMYYTLSIAHGIKSLSDINQGLNHQAYNYAKVSKSTSNLYSSITTQLN